MNKTAELYNRIRTIALREEIGKSPQGQTDYGLRLETPFYRRYSNNELVNFFNEVIRPKSLRRYKNAN